MNASRETPLPIVILSGGTGRTADHVLTAALAQFDDPRVAVIRKTDIRRTRDAEHIVEQAAEDGAIVSYKATEEVASEIIELLPSRERRGRGQTARTTSA